MTLVFIQMLLFDTDTSRTYRVMVQYKKGVF